MPLHRDHDQHDRRRGTTPVQDRDYDARPDLPPPAPEDAVVTRDVEQQIREDERTRVQRELAELAHDGDGDTRPPMTDRDVDRDVNGRPEDVDGRRDRWEDWADARADDDATGIDPDAVRGDGTVRREDAIRRDATVRHDDAYVTPAAGTRLDDDRVRGAYVEEEVVRDRAFSVGQAITLLVGAALTAWGIIALVATGIDTPLDQPVEEVFGFDHTPWMGIAQVAAGVLLMIAALRPQGRWLAGLIGAALIAVGVMILLEMDWTIDELGTEQSFGWIPVIAGALALLGALLTPPRHQTVTETHRIDRDDVDRYDDRSRTHA